MTQEFTQQNGEVVVSGFGPGEEKLKRFRCCGMCGCPYTVCQLASVFVIQIVYVLVMVGYGSISSSMTSTSEGCHAVSDAIAYFCNLYLQLASYRKVSSKYPFGYERATVFGGLVSGVFLISSSLFLIIESTRQLSTSNTERPHNPSIMVYIGLAGVVLNFVRMAIMKGSGHTHSHGHGTAEPCNHAHSGEQTELQDLNSHGVLIHLAMDGLSSFVVACVGFLETNYEHVPLVQYADIAGCIIIVCMCLFFSIPLLLSAFEVFMINSPTRVDVTAIRRDLLNQAWVRNVTKLIVWELHPGSKSIIGACILTAADLRSSRLLLLSEGAIEIDRLHQVHNLLINQVTAVLEHHGVTSTTVEVRYSDE
jgi:cation diffusion facilitator family transporter|eukprot:Stramenopile-MAST_4_protein_214